MKNKNLKTKLLELQGVSSSDSLEHYVLNHILVTEALTEDKDIRDFFIDLDKGGCGAGVTGLTTYVQNEAFFDKYYEQIEELRVENRVLICGGIKNHFAWFGFEEAARILAEKLGIEY